MHHAHSCAEGTPKRIAIARKLLFTMDLPCISAPKLPNLQVAKFCKNHKDGANTTPTAVQGASLSVSL